MKTKGHRLHPKAVLGLFLNHATHNSETISAAVFGKPDPTKKETIKFKVGEDTDCSKSEEMFRHFFPFVSALEKQSATEDHRDYLLRRKNLFLDMQLLLKDARNYYSHFDYVGEVPAASVWPGETLPFLRVCLEKAKDSARRNPENPAPETAFFADPAFAFFGEAGAAPASLHANSRALAFLASFFLNKRQCELLISRLAGLYEGVGDDDKRLFAGLFSACCMKNNSYFVSERNEVAMFVDLISYVSKVPPLVFDNFEAGTVGFRLTKDSYHAIKNLLLPPKSELISKKSIADAKETEKNLRCMYDDIKGKLYASPEEISAAICTYAEDAYFKEYKKIILEKTQEVYLLRAEKNDRFAFFALKFIDDSRGKDGLKRLLPSIDFKVYTGGRVPKDYSKKYDGGEVFKRSNLVPETTYANLNDYPGGDYFMAQNNVFFRAKFPGGQTADGFISIHELPNLMFLLLQSPKDAANAENALLGYLADMQSFYGEILGGASPEEAKASALAKGIAGGEEATGYKYSLPSYISDWIEGPAPTDASFMQAVLSRLDYIGKEAQKRQEDLHRLKKYDKIRETVKFLNRFNENTRGADGRRDYLNIEQHQQMEILLGTFPKSKQELLKFLDDENISAGYNTDGKRFAFADFVRDADSLNGILVSVAGFEKNWAKKETEGLRASKSMEKAIQTGKKIKVSPKTVSWERVCENIGKFLAHSIAIPRGFILHKFFPGKSSINEQVEKLRAADFSLPAFYGKTKPYKGGSGDDKTLLENYRRFGGEIEFLKKKDKLLGLMALEYKKMMDEALQPQNTTENAFKVVYSPPRPEASGLSDIFNSHYEINVDGKNIRFKNLHYYQAANVLQSENLQNVLKTYFPKTQKTTWFIDPDKYQGKKEEEEHNPGEGKLYDLQDAFFRVEWEHLQIVDLVMKIEEVICSGLTPAKTDELRVKSDKKKKNRIATQFLFTGEFSFEKDFFNNQIRTPRNQSFHGSVPAEGETPFKEAIHSLSFIYAERLLAKLIKNIIAWDTVGKTKELLWEIEAQRAEIALAHKKAPSLIIGPQKIKEVFDTIKSQYPPNFVPPIGQTHQIYVIKSFK